eukprot:8148805-Lingulodinium_polyedra.AAC.1
MEVNARACIGLDFALLAAKLVLASRSALGTHSRWARTATVELVPPVGARRAAGWRKSNGNSLVVLH